MNNNKTIVLASNNAGKIKEFNSILGDLDIKVIAQHEVNASDCDEPYQTFIENALHKARHCSAFTHLPVLADDSGLCIDALGGKPGIYSKRFATMQDEYGDGATYGSNSQKVLRLLKDVNHSQRQAFYYCLLVLITNTSDPRPIIAHGILKGEIALKPMGENGFGYDSIFYLPQHGKTVAQLTASQKNAISQRKAAIDDLVRQMDIVFCHSRAGENPCIKSD